MNYREIVKRNNPIIYGMIKNAIEKNKLSHAYLFSSPKGIDISNEINFFIQSLISKKPFENDFLRNVSSYSDLEIISGEKELIKKEAVIKAMNRFKQTSLEKKGKKILLIKNIENTNKYSLNALLKFLEEPASNTYLLLTTNNLSSVLSTIKSRTQIISIKFKSSQEIISNFIQAGIDRKNASLLSTITSSLEKVKKIDLVDFLKIKKDILDALSLSLNYPSAFYTNLYHKINKNNLNIYAPLLITFFNDIWRFETGVSVIFQEQSLLEKYSLSKFNFFEAIKLIGDFIEGVNSLVNFELYKSMFFIKLVRLYG